MYVIYQKGKATGFNKYFISNYYDIAAHAYTIIRPCIISFEHPKTVEDCSNNDDNKCDAKDNVFKQYNISDLNIKKIIQVRDMYEYIKKLVISELDNKCQIKLDSSIELQFVEYSISTSSKYTMNYDTYQQLLDNCGLNSTKLSDNSNGNTTDDDIDNKNEEDTKKNSDNGDCNEDSDIDNNNNNTKYSKLQDLSQYGANKMLNHKDSIKIVKNNGFIVTLSFNSNNVCKLIELAGIYACGHVPIGNGWVYNMSYATNNLIYHGTKYIYICDDFKTKKEKLKDPVHAISIIIRDYNIHVARLMEQLHISYQKY